MPDETNDKQLNAKDFVVIPKRQCVHYKGKIIFLKTPSGIIFKLMTSLCALAPYCADRDELLEAGWGRYSGTPNKLDQAIPRLNRKLRPHGLEVLNEVGSGYKLVLSTESWLSLSEFETEEYDVQEPHSWEAPSATQSSISHEETAEDDRFEHSQTLSKAKCILEPSAIIEGRAEVRVSGFVESTSRELDSEKEFLALASGRSLHLGDFDLCCKLFPPHLWDSESYEPFIDNVEDEVRIELVEVASTLPPDILSKLIEEMRSALSVPNSNLTRTPFPSSPNKEIEDIRECYRRLTLEDSDSHPRLAGNPVIVSDEYRSILRVPIAQSRFGIALAQERHLNLPTAKALASQHVLNSLAVRVAYVFEDEEGRDWVELQQRKRRQNATYGGAWDVSASGYIDLKKCRERQPPKQVSPWRACASELAQELQIPRFELPSRENYYFLGLGRNEPTGQLDLLAYCLGSYVPSPERRKSPFVNCYARCLLEPDAVAATVLEMRHWVPTAILTLILTLQVHWGYPRSRISEAFEKCREGLNLEP